MNILLIGDTSNRHNWGCRATSFQLRSLLQEAGTLTGSVDTSFLTDPVEPHLSFSRREQLSRSPANRSGLRSAMFDSVSPLLFRARPELIARFKRMVDLMGPDDLNPMADAIAEARIFPHIAAAIADADAVFINGEGSFLKNRGVSRFKMLFAYVARTRFGKKTAIVNHTADLRSPALQTLAEKVYPVLDDCLFRESYSLTQARELRLNPKAEFAADCAFLFDPISPQIFGQVAGRTDYLSIYPENATGFDPRHPYICVGGSSAYLESENAFDRLRHGYEALCERLMRHAPVVMTASSYPDDIILRPVARKLGLPFLGLATPVQQATDVLGNAAAYVGGRWHPSILAMTGGTPIISFSANSDYKSRGINNLAGLDQPTISSFSIDEAFPLIERIIADHLDKGEALRGKIRERVEGLRHSCRRTLRMLD